MAVRKTTDVTANTAAAWRGRLHSEQYKLRPPPTTRIRPTNPSQPSPGAKTEATTGNTEMNPIPTRIVMPKAARDHARLAGVCPVIQPSTKQAVSKARAG